MLQSGVWGKVCWLDTTTREWRACGLQRTCVQATSTHWPRTLYPWTSQVAAQLTFPVIHMPDSDFFCCISSCIWTCITQASNILCKAWPFELTNSTRLSKACVSAPSDYASHLYVCENINLKIKSGIAYACMRRSSQHPCLCCTLILNICRECRLASAPN